MPAADSDEGGVPHWILAYDQLCWVKPILNNNEAPDDIVSYYDYLVENYPVKEDHPKANQNKAIIEDRLASFAIQGGPGAKFKSAREKMLKQISLPKGAKEELNYPAEIADKIINGVPLWDEKDDQEPEHDVNSGKDKKQLT